MTKKYLKLTNTPKALELGKCLIGSGIKCSHEKDRLKYWDGWFLVTYDPILDIPSEDSFISEILLPLDTLKLCPFMAMKYGIEVEAPRVYFDNEGDKAKGVLRTDTALNFFIMNEKTGGCADIKVETISLDRNNLPEGASVVEL